VRRLLALWLALIATFWVGRIVISVALYSNFDFTFRSLLELIVVPGLQAAVVAWTMRSGRGTPLLAPWRQGLETPALRLVLIGDGVVLLAAVLASRLGAAGGLFGFANADGLPRLALAGKLALAAVLLVVAARGRRGSGLVLWLLALGLAALASERWTGWIVNGPQWIFPDRPLLAQWLRFVLPLVLAIILLLLGAQAVLARRSLVAARAVDWALAVGLVGTAVLVGGFFLRPYLREPWTSVAWASASLTATALVLAAGLAASERRTSVP
jgi:hypothetical protein